jgi:hypothetical protein
VPKNQGLSGAPERKGQRKLKTRIFSPPTNKKFMTKLNQMLIKTMKHDLLRKIYVEDYSITRFLNGLISRSVNYADGKGK